MSTNAVHFGDKHVVVVGAGIAGLATAHHLLKQPNPPRVTIVESNDRVGGVIHASPFAGLDSLDESADAFLTRTPAAMSLAADVGLDQQLTSPARSHAYIWSNGMHPIPHNMVLGVPGSLSSIWQTPVLSASGKLRASFEQLIPSPIGRGHDNMGKAIRSRFGTQVLERLVDPLVGSIYATDTDHFSVQGMPQVAELLAQRGSLTRASHRAIQRRTEGGPIFATPLGGMSALTSAVHHSIVERGCEVLLSSPVNEIVRNEKSYVLNCGSNSIDADAIVLATPAKHTAPFMQTLDADIAAQFAHVEHASVVMVALTVPRSQWPQHLTGTGYLVPKPMQTAVTAVSFGSNKWAHWQTTDNDMILRVSLGRDGMPMHHLDDDRLLALALADLQWHLGIDVQPTHVRLTRWVESFPQYRPGHSERIDWLERTLGAVAPGIAIAGASYRGIGIPACIASAQRAASQTLNALGS